MLTATPPFHKPCYNSFLQYEYASLDNPKPGKTKLAIHIWEQIYNYWEVNSEMSIHRSNNRHTNKNVKYE